MAAINKKYYKWCFVPSCTSSSTNTPNKLFITVPTEYSRKLQWFKAVGRDMPKSQSSFICCEDHFNLEQDMLNYMRFKMLGGKIKLRRDVVPHIFKEDEKEVTPEDPELVRRQRQLIVEQAILELTPVTIAETSESNLNKDSVRSESVQSDEFEFVECSDRTMDLTVLSVETTNDSDVVKCSDQAMQSNLYSRNVRYRSVGVQARPHYRSKWTMFRADLNLIPFGRNKDC